MVLVLTKIDMVSRDHMNKWKHYFSTNFPELTIAEVTSFPNYDAPTREKEIDIKMHRRKRKCENPFGLPELLEKCRTALSRGDDFGEIFDDLISEHRKKSKEYEDNAPEPEIIPQYDQDDYDDSDEVEIQHDPEDHNGDDDAHEKSDAQVENGKEESSYNDHKSYVAMGMIGHPNVGKSSLINALMGTPKVAVSAAPGRTKHLQTLFLHPKVQLVDCPGLVFPAVDMPLPLQVLCGVVPIAQVSEPYSSVQYLAERLPVEKIYKLKPPYVSGGSNRHKKHRKRRSHDTHINNSPENYSWSAWEICDAYADLKQYRTKKGRLDSYRAANEILRHCFFGKTILSFLPPSKDISIISIVESSAGCEDINGNVEADEMEKKD